MTMNLTHLRQLEAESIHIIREVVAEFERPVLLFSGGKDSACMLHVARKAFYPARPPFPLLHINTTWDFRDLLDYRDRFCREHGLELAEVGQRAGGGHAGTLACRRSRTASAQPHERVTPAPPWP